MRMVNACTLEIDDIELATAEIKKQLNLESNGQKYAAGFITCSYDYVESGVVEALSGALPFDVVGCTTLTNAIDGEAGTMMLGLTLLTADDCRFVSSASVPLVGDLDGSVGTMYEEALARLGEPPKLVLAFLPINTPYGGELILASLDRIAGGAPVFGTTACDFDTAQYRHSYTFHNGACAADRLSVLLIGGNVNPRFIVTATSEQNIYNQHAVITASEGSTLKEVNGMSAREYFSSIGLMQDSGLEAVSSVPFVVNYKDGTQPVARAIYSLNEDGSAVCGGFMPEGGTLSIGRMDVEDILKSADYSLRTLLAAGDVNGIITFPCLGRSMVLGVDPLIETEKVNEVIGGRVPWHLAYSGGEVCPVYIGDEATVNRFHNFTFIACAI